MRLNRPEDSLGEADFHPSTRSAGFRDTPWLIAPTVDAGIRFSRFEQLPHDQRPTREQLMNQSLPRNEELKDKWPQYVGAARTAWGEITEEELRQLDNAPAQLAGLIHNRYSVTREEADMQVKRFFANYNF